MPGGVERRTKIADHEFSSGVGAIALPRCAGGDRRVALPENEKSSGTILLGHAEHIHQFELASGGIERRVFAAHPRRVPSNEAKSLHVPAIQRSRGGVERPVQLIIRSVRIPQTIRSAVMGRLSEHGRGNSGGKKYHSTKCFHFGHLDFSVLRVIADVREAR
jgi:hypothetical protein